MLALLAECRRGKGGGRPCYTLPAGFEARTTDPTACYLAWLAEAAVTP